MKMKRCKCCGWYFEPQTPRQAYCDDECRQEGRLTSWSRYGKKRYARKKSEKAAEKAKPKPSATLKVDVSRLPNPPLPATKEVRIGEVVTDAEISSLIEHFSYDPSSSKKNVYTEDEDATIIRMAEEGATYSMIANKIGGNPNAIRIQHEKLISAGIGKAQ